MAHTDSAKKRIRQNELARLRNKARASKMKTAVKSVLAGVENAVAPEALEAAYRKAASELDRAAKRRVIHPNAASRAKSRLAKRVKNASTSAK